MCFKKGPSVCVCVCFQKSWESHGGGRARGGGGGGGLGVELPGTKARPPVVLDSLVSCVCRFPLYLKHNTDGTEMKEDAVRWHNTCFSDWIVLQKTDQTHFSMLFFLPLSTTTTTERKLTLHSKDCGMSLSIRAGESRVHEKRLFSRRTDGSCGGWLKSTRHKCFGCVVGLDGLSELAASWAACSSLLDWLTAKWGSPTSRLCTPPPFLSLCHCHRLNLLGSTPSQSPHCSLERGTVDL